MFDKIVECVPNFSEGRDLSIINQITDEIKNTEEVTLLDVDPGFDTNRTVVTMVGSPKGVKEAAFKAIKKASELIDMRKHKGAHARQGATDVCPLVPIKGLTVEECIEIAKEIGKRVGEELEIPIYLYEKAATKPERRNLADIRKGEYEALEEKLKKEEWKPDFGPAKFNAKAGVTVVGVRDFLIAYNVNLNTKDPLYAKDIAMNIREKGRSIRKPGIRPFYREGELIRDENGKTINKPGLFDECKATGWYIDEYKCAQVTINLTNYKVTSMEMVYDEIEKQAFERGLRVTGSELVGLIPLDAIIKAGKYYLKKQYKTTGVPEKEIIECAIKSLGLNDLTPFNPEEKIIEYRLKREFSLVNMKVNDFIDELSTNSPAPGGGSVAALCGSLGAGLGAMVCNLSYDKPEYEENRQLFINLADKMQILKDKILANVDKDTDAFNIMFKAMKLPKKTDAQKAFREIEMENATKLAAEVPLNTAILCVEGLKTAVEIAKIGNVNAISDIGVGGLNLYVGFKGALYNVLINIQTLKDLDYIENTKKQLKELESEANRLSEEVQSIVQSRGNLKL